MSVLNTMLRDLERRGARPSAPLPGLATESLGATLSSSILSEGFDGATGRRRGGRTRLPYLVAAALVIVAAAWFWVRSHPLSTGSASQPVPIAADPARTAAAATPAGSSAAAAVSPPPTAAPALSNALMAQRAGAEISVASRSPHDPGPRPAATSPRSAPVANPAKAPPAGPQRGVDAPAAVRAPIPQVSVSSNQSDLAHATDLIGHGQAVEAEAILLSVLDRKPAMQEARSALAALQAERGGRREALATLLGGVEFDAARFAPTAAQLQAELGDPAGAMQTLDRIEPAARTAAFHALAGAIAQRAGQHARAVDEYQRNLQSDGAPSLSWVGLGVSLQALGRDAQALQAYQSALQGVLTPPIRRFVQQRLLEAQGSASAHAAQGNEAGKAADAADPPR